MPRIERVAVSTSLLTLAPLAAVPRRLITTSLFMVAHGLNFMTAVPAWAQCELHETAKLTASNAAQEDFFGGSVSISGDVAVVGARGHDCGAGADCGSAYVYRFNGNIWVEEQKLTASDAALGNFFGWSVSVSADVVVVGAIFDDCGDGRDCGSAYVYRFNGNNWAEEQKLTASDARFVDYFGWSISVSGDVAVVGARGYDCGAGPDCGSAYVFALPVSDCNANGITDDCDIHAGDSQDTDGNGVPDECETGACCDQDPFGGCTNGLFRAECNCGQCEWTELASCDDVECLHDSIPTVSAWGLAILSLLLLIAAKVRFGRVWHSRAPW